MNTQPSEPAVDHPVLSTAAILQQLKLIQESRAFCNSPRAKEFLSYVVEHGLAGDTELLKERSIGVNLFHRSPSYITSDDPIVRVKAAEVRRRLAQFYGEENQELEVRIEIPIGSYIPKFHLKQQQTPTAPETASTTPTAPEDVASTPPEVSRQSKGRLWRTWIAVAALVIIGTAVTVRLARHPQQKSPLEEFWAPVYATSQPVLIYLPSPVSYALSSNVYQKAMEQHPGLYDPNLNEELTPIQLDPETNLRWKDLNQLENYFVNKDDANVACNLAGLFARIHKDSLVRMGNDLRYGDLRSSPAVLIGAYNNSWTMRVGNEMPFTFRDPDRAITEKGGQRRVWRKVGEKNRGDKDFAIVARIVNSKTGQFLVVVGGIGMVGTQAAGMFISQSGDLDAALQNAPKGWQGKNLEIVLETDVIDTAASRPQVVAFSTW